jgi:hypothetical protein
VASAIRDETSYTSRNNQTPHTGKLSG